MIWLFSHLILDCMWKHKAILNSQSFFYSVGSRSYHGRYRSVNCNRDRDTHFVFNFIYFSFPINNILWRCKFSEYLDGNKTKQTLAEATDETPTYNALLYFPHTILLRGVYVETFFLGSYGERVGGSYGNSPSRRLYGKGPKDFLPRHT